MNDDPWIYYILVVGGEGLVLIAVYWLVSLNKDILAKFKIIENRILDIDSKSKEIIENNTRVVDKLEGNLDKLDSSLDRVADAQHATAQILADLKGTISTEVANLKTEIIKSKN